MADDELRVAAAVYAVIAAVISRRRRRRKLRWKNRRWWSRPWILRRDDGGRELHSLLQDELRLEDKESYKSFLRMGETEFLTLLRLVGPRITKKNTVMRQCISAAKR